MAGSNVVFYPQLHTHIEFLPTICSHLLFDAQKWRKKISVFILSFLSIQSLQRKIKLGRKVAELIGATFM